MAVKPRGKGFQANFMIAGERFVAQFQTREEAELWEAQIRSAKALGQSLPSVDDQHRVKSSEVRTLGDLIRYTERKKWDHNRDGVNSVRNAWDFAKWVGEKVPVTAALNGDKIEDYLEWRKRTKLNSGSTLNRHRAAISVLCTYAMKLGILARRPDIRRYAEGDCRERIFNDEEEFQILETLKLWNNLDEHDWMVFLCDTGCRAGESRKLNWEDIIRHKDGTAILDIPSRITKSAKGRVVGLTPRAIEALDRMKARHPGSKGPFHCISRTKVRGLWERLRGHIPWMDEHCVLHTWRHTFGSRVVQETGSLYLAQKALGHANPVTTMRYAKYTPKNMTDLAAVLHKRNEARYA